MAFAYLDASDIVVFTSDISRTLGEVQVVSPEITQIITGAPDELQGTRDRFPRFAQVHQKVSGDGTDISHYNLIANTFPEPVVPRDFLFLSAPAVTTSTTFVDALAGGSLSPAEQGDGVYVILFESEVLHSGNNGAVEMQLLLNATPIPTAIREASNGANGTMQIIITQVIPKLLTTDVITAEFRNSGTGGDVTALRRRLGLRRIR